MRWNTIAIIGVGLIGGSVGLALRRRDICQRIVGIGRRAETLKFAERVGAIHQATTDLAEGVRHAELVVVCSPVAYVADHVLEAAKHCPPGTLITDAGSTKQRIVRQVDRRLDRTRGVEYVGSHPIAGGEKTGPEAARADLFDGRLVIVTPTTRSAPEAVRSIEQLWQSLGARTERQTPAAHDRLLAHTSHLPHVLAAALAACTAENQFPYTGSGWADTTRIAAGDPQLWRQILIHNQGHVLKSLDKFIGMLERFRAALAHEDERELVRLLTAGKKHRDAVGN